ncbi:tyrosine-type recombinase/integrase [Phytoactinopolyspora mesophila]|uniref:Tyrosine-type recombinase/integrase n=1 Tax=Phytoactinopolyspora mesophila TaxID=2650750 RepID=A0A7K3MDK4_9ACTN|nr:tyrosine-type recombinase/integrase [Phytoactinopolyspora mesophila]NDL61137.1 tyrosine-type recombinase/integrase [Phytoactinopolyspora mesophila]
MTDERFLRVVGDRDVVHELWNDLPEMWRGPVIGPEIPYWKIITSPNHTTIDLTGLPRRLHVELAWMAHWHVLDGMQVPHPALIQLATILRTAIRHGRPVPTSLQEMDWDTASGLRQWYFATRWRRFPSKRTQTGIRAIVRFPRNALIARCSNEPWWRLDNWIPRCDKRIPLPQDEPHAHASCSPGRIRTPWLREGAKWYLGMTVESGMLRWTTVCGSELKGLVQFDHWLTSTFENPEDVFGDPDAAFEQAAAFARWTSDRRNRGGHHRSADRLRVSPEQTAQDLGAVSKLFEYIVVNPSESRKTLGPSPWDRATGTHVASWHPQRRSVPARTSSRPEQYIDKKAQIQILAALPLLELPREQQKEVTTGDGQHVIVYGLGDPQAMRITLLQILTGRRASEIRTCIFDCLFSSPGYSLSPESSAPDEIAGFAYAQTKIDGAPAYILVDQTVIAVIEEQRRWIREHYPDIEPKYLFVQRTGNRNGNKPYNAGTYDAKLRELSDIVRIVDSRGRRVHLSQTHRFRHTRITELSDHLSLKALQRYAGHRSAAMTMHYVADREVLTEQALIAARRSDVRYDGYRLSGRKTHAPGADS